MADIAKKDRKPPQPRGLNVELPLVTTQELQELGLLAGHTTKSDLEDAFTAFLVSDGLNAFRLHLLDLGSQRVAAARAKLVKDSDPELTSSEVVDLMGALKESLAASRPGIQEQEDHRRRSGAAARPTLEESADKQIAAGQL